MWESVPEPVRAVVERLRRAGEQAVLVGGCVRDLARARPVRDWDVATTARPEVVLELFPRAVPIGLRHGTVMVPTASGPVDVTPFRGHDLLEDLARRDFTVNAVALDPERLALVDPHGGLADLEAGRLRAVGDAAARLAEDPLRAVRAARFASELSLEASPELASALAAVGGAMRTVAAERVRAELERLLLGGEPARGVRLLRASGLEDELVPGAREDAAAVLAATPSDLTLRWAVWLRGTAAPKLLARWRVPHARARDVHMLLALHPVDEAVPAQDAAARRLLRRAGFENADRLVALREAEIDAGAAPAEARARLDALCATLARVRRSGTLALARTDLALDGRDVMEILGVGPGPAVGRALRFLTECVLDDPAANEPEVLRDRLLTWQRQQGGGARPREAAR